ncbi:hypothetical protein HON58_02855, partial [Candidatus Peregrinibacteria bacterium]|nr:hypothetical protein [Candidatus Peregrinibacteria bacterium]
GENPNTQYDQLHDHLETAQNLREAQAKIENNAHKLEGLKDFHQGVFETNTAPLLSTLSWIEVIFNNDLLNEKFKKWIIFNSPVEKYCRFEKALEKLILNHSQIIKILQQLQTIGDVMPGSLFDQSIQTNQAENFLKALKEAHSKTDILLRWNDFQKTLNWIEKNGFANLIAFAKSHKISGEAYNVVVETSYLYQWLNEIFNKYPDLWDFERIDHASTREIFAQEDKNLPKYYQKHINQILFRSGSLRPSGISRGRVSSFTEMALIAHEVKKKKRHMPLRHLLKKAYTSLNKLFPCFMMSPSSVAQFLPKREVEFDLLVMDEASQIKPEDALGSLARAKQIVIVGDSKQMPPSDIFDSSSTVDDNDSQISAAEDIKSILEIAEQHYLQESLVWHYRSFHQSLIQFSNENYYDQRLIIPPSSYFSSDEYGIKWNYCEGALYHEGINEVEAGKITEFLVRHVILESVKQPEKQESIGVIAMNRRQQSLINELYENEILKNDELAEALKSFSHADDIFIRNLENVQGDERDIIAISFTYGPDPASGRTYQRFGPIANDGGWRRLNVLFTRSRKRLHVFSSMKSKDVKLAKIRGVSNLKAYLKYAEEGCLPDFGEATGRGPDSPFEESVGRVIRDMGYEVHSQVGSCGFFIDLGVTDPESPGTYLCGIECDGASYHSHPVTRDRDRIREEILVSRGWKIYRIWSTDWFKNKTCEIERLKNYLEFITNQDEVL